jgi:ABC-type polysaccharide/polyol phosphate export permease
VIGVAWAIVRPLLTMVIFTVLFGTLARLPSDGATPYPLLVFAGMLPWFLFSSILSDASHSLIGNAGLIGKVYLAPVYNHLIAQGLRIGVYEVAASAMHGLGTPEDLEAYVARRSMSAKGARS